MLFHCLFGVFHLIKRFEDSLTGTISLKLDKNKHVTLLFSCVVPSHVKKLFWMQLSKDAAGLSKRAILGLCSLKIASIGFRANYT